MSIKVSSLIKSQKAVYRIQKSVKQPRLINSVFVLLAGMIVFLLSGLIAMHGDDWDAWIIAFLNIDPLFPIAILLLGVGLILDRIIVGKYVQNTVGRFVFWALIAAAIGLFNLNQPGFDFVMGNPKNDSMKLICCRHISTIAGGGLTGVYVQFEIEPYALEQMMNSAGYVEVKRLTAFMSKPSQMDVERFKDPFSESQTIRVFTKTWHSAEILNDNTMLWYVPTKKLASARRYQY